MSRIYELPNSFVARSYLQERADRFAIERLFITREEHHQRQSMKVQEEHDITELLAVFAYSKQEAILGAHQEGELELLNKRLQEQHHLTHRRWDIEHLSKRAEDEQGSLRARQHQVERSMMLRDEQLKLAQSNWSKTSAAMDVQIEALKRDLEAAKARNESEDDRQATNVLIEDQAKLERRAPGEPLETAAYRKRLLTDDLSSVTGRTNMALSRAQQVLYGADDSLGGSFAVPQTNLSEDMYA